MRGEGNVSFYVVQHRHPEEEEWSDTDLSHVWFSPMSYDERRGAVAAHLRDLLAKQGASTPLWQRYGLHGFTEEADALQALVTSRATTSALEFRLVFRHMSRSQEVIA